MLLTLQDAWPGPCPSNPISTCSLQKQNEGILGFFVHLPSTHSPSPSSEEAEPLSLPSLRSLPSVSICPEPRVPSHYVTIHHPMPGSLTCPLLHPPRLLQGWAPLAFHSQLSEPRVQSPAWMEGLMTERTIFGFGKQIYLPRSGFLKMIVK